jgi:hypothetical protein
LPLDNDLKAAKQMRLPWWVMLCGIIGSVLIAWLFDHFGRFDLARPALYSIAMLGIAVAIKWKLRRHLWFWNTVTVIVALHVLLVLFVPWTTKWVPAIVIIPIGIADLFATLAILSVVGKFMEGPKTSV